MNDQEHEATKARIRALDEKWTERLVAGWRITLAYVREDFKVNDEISPGTLASSDAHWPYKFATISFNMPQCLQNDDEELEEAFVHELCHLLVNELRWREGEDKDGYRLEHEEHTCTILARAVIRVSNLAISA